MKKMVVFLLPVFFSLLSPSKSFAAVPSGFSDSRIFGNLNQPTAMVFTPDGRLFFTEKEGKVRVVKTPESNPTLLPTPFLTVTTSINDGERGLLGITLDPHFPQEPYVYVYYTHPSVPPYNQVSRFTVSSSNPDIADPSSEIVLLRFENLTALIHNGGAIHFGLDGKLYIAIGDDKIPSSAQNLNTNLGKILRINRDGSVPTDNPFYTTATDVRSKIYALGFRSPFTFAIHPTSGLILLNDVGEGSWEEVNKIEKGKNYGWPVCEGICTNSNSLYVDPVYTFSHNGEGAAVTGAHFYEGSQFPSSYKDKYFFADYVNNWVRTLDPANNFAVSSFADNQPGTVDIKEGPLGSLFTLTHWNSLSPDPNKGEMYKISYGAAGPSPTPSLTPTPASLPPTATILTPIDGTTYRGGDTISYSGTATDPEDGTLPPSAFMWSIVFHHNTHIHPFIDNVSGVTSGTFQIPTINEVDDNVWYRIHLTVTDSSGVSTAVYRDILPQKVTLSVNTVPSGLQFTIDGQPQTAPFSVLGVSGIRREIGTVEPQTFNTKTYVFSSWSDGGACRHFISTPNTSTTYTLTYKEGTVDKRFFGDANCDGIVNWADFKLWIANYLIPYAVATDFSGDGKTNAMDFARFVIGQNLP